VFLANIRGNISLNKHMFGSGGIAPAFLTSAPVADEWSDSRPVLYAPECTRYPLDRRLSGLHSRSGRCRENKNLSSAENPISAVQLKYIVIVSYTCETLRLPHFLDNRLTFGGEVVGLTRRPHCAPMKIPGTHFC
jgi:hypothetical protein